MPGLKTNEREGTRAVLRHARISPYKVREVLDLVRGRPVHEAEDILRFSERDAAQVVLKVLRSSVANAENNDEQDPEELFVSACFADEGTTIKRWRPRARGRATRIRKRTSHITVIVSRLPEDELERLQARRRAEQLAQRARRVAGARKAEGDTRSRAERRRGVALDEEHDHEHEGEDESAADAEAGDASDGGIAEGDQPPADSVTDSGSDDSPAADETESEEPVAEAEEPVAAVEAATETEAEPEAKAEAETETEDAAPETEADAKAEEEEGE